MEDPDFTDHLYVYGSDKIHIEALVTESPALGSKLHPDLDYIKAEVIWAARAEMARSVEDVLARRLRALFLDARASLEIAPEVARLLAAELGKDTAWQKDQVNQFTALARGYMV